MTARELIGIFRAAGIQSIADRVPRLGAALAFYMTFSLAPLLVVVIAIAGLVFGRQAAQGELLHEIASVVSEETATALQSMIASAERQGAGLKASILGFGISLIGAIGLFCELKDALNTVFNAPASAQSVLKTLLRSRIHSVLLMLASSVLLIAALIASTAMTILTSLSQHNRHLTVITSMSMQIASTCTSFALIIVLLAMIYRLLPDVTLPWSEVLMGSVVASLLLYAGKVLLTLYLNKAAGASLYGAAASLVMVMLWNYYIAQIVLFGAEIAKATGRRSDTRQQHGAA